MDTSPSVIMLVFTILGSLGLLIFGMKSMSDALQKLAGPQLRHILGKMTTNRFTGMLTGVLVTAAVQSSTATTVMTVSFVNASLLTLGQAISVIMGANIGTTLTAWIMSAGFSFNVTDVVWPVFIIGMILIYRKRNATIGEFLFGLAFMFLGLGTLRATGVQMNLGENEAVLGFFQSFNPNSIWTTLLFLLIGSILTMCVQSSAAVMAITMILCSSGALPIYQGIALVMGENIGTTVTSNLAALTASTQARRAAFAHMFFNVFGVMWMIIVLHPFIDMVCSLVGYEQGVSDPARLSVVLAMFHTCFNITNTAILIGFIPQIEKIVCWAIKDKPEAEKETVRLKYIGNGLVQTPEIAVLQAEKETATFGVFVQEMFAKVRQLFDEKDDSKFAELFAVIENKEAISDQIEIEIAKYLEQVSYDHLSDETKVKIRQMMREISELESVGDSCYNLARTMRRKMESGEKFTQWQKKNLHEMMKLCDDALANMNQVMIGHRSEHDVNESFRIENEINAMRHMLKNENIRNVNELKYDYAVGTMFSDLVTDCEKLGDYVVNVVEARIGK
ncbi:MAG: Na/Pi cotransporter family protein [Bacteroidales bacterium]|nr:Na/Pi cotransporter family protein [Bacteroidales bacterium]